MNPEVDQILVLSAGQLLGGIVPLLPAGYPQGTASLVSFMMMFAAQEYERGADIRAAENADMRALFGELAPMVSDAALKASLEQAAGSNDSSLKISALNASNAELRKLLIVLQTHLESRDGHDARTGEARIWNVLKAAAGRRLLKLHMA
jgi:hypothetical protein